MEQVIVSVKHPNQKRSASLPPELWQRAEEAATKLLQPQPKGTFLKLILWNSFFGGSVTFKGWWQEYED